MNGQQQFQPECYADHLRWILLLILLNDLLEKLLDMLLLRELRQSFLYKLLVFVGEDPVDLVSVLRGERLLQNHLQGSALDVGARAGFAAINALDFAKVEKGGAGLQLLMVLNASNLVFFPTSFLLWHHLFLRSPLEVDFLLKRRSILFNKTDFLLDNLKCISISHRYGRHVYYLMLKNRVHFLLNLHHAIDLLDLARLVFLWDFGHVEVERIRRTAGCDVGALHDLVRWNTLNQLRGGRNIQNLRGLNDLLNALLLIFVRHDLPEKAFRASSTDKMRWDILVFDELDALNGRAVALKLCDHLVLYEVSEMNGLIVGLQSKLVVTTQTHHLRNLRLFLLGDKRLLNFAFFGLV